MESNWQNKFESLLLTSILLGASGFFALGYFIGKEEVIGSLIFFAFFIFLAILTLGCALADYELDRDIKRWPGGG